MDYGRVDRRRMDLLRCTTDNWLLRNTTHTSPHIQEEESLDMLIELVTRSQNEYVLMVVLFATPYSWIHVTYVVVVCMCWLGYVNDDRDIIIIVALQIRRF